MESADVRNGTATDVQPIDRLEEKVRQLVGMIDTLRAERAQAADEVAQLTRELEAGRARLVRGGHHVDRTPHAA